MDTRLAPTPGYPHVSYDVDRGKLLARHAAVVSGGSWYDFGAKDAPSVDPKNVDGIDCSGYTRYLLVPLGVPLPDGSFNQGRWAETVGGVGLKVSDAASATRKDGVLRLAILPARGRRPGHALLILDGLTIESRGGKGPSRREWNGLGWRTECKVFVVSRPRVIP